MPESGYVGAYNAEGFGRVIVNPSFLEADAQGMAICSVGKTQDPSHAQRAERKTEESGSLLVSYLKRCRLEDARKNNIYEVVNDFVGRYGGRFKGRAFASQWGTIRSIANAHSDGQELMSLLFDGPKAYLTHGVAKEKWEERGRLSLFKNFCRDQSAEDLQLVLVDLASEMAKNADKGGSNNSDEAICAVSEVYFCK